MIHPINSSVRGPIPLSHYSLSCISFGFRTWGDCLRFQEQVFDNNYWSLWQGDSFGFAALALWLWRTIWKQTASRDFVLQCHKRPFALTKIPRKSCWSRTCRISKHSQKENQSKKILICRNWNQNCLSHQSDCPMCIKWKDLWYNSSQSCRSAPFHETLQHWLCGWGENFQPTCDCGWSR